MRYEVGSRIETCERLGVEPARVPVAGELEQLEGKTLPSVTALFVNGELNIVSNSNDNITVDAVGPAGAQTVQVLLNNVVATTVANRPTSSVTSIVVQGGNLSNLIDLSRVGSANYPNLQGIRVDAGHGGDTILGSNGIDETLLGNHGEDLITCQIGNSTVLGGDGNDTITGGGGNDNLMGEDGNDSIDAGAGDDTVDGHDGTDVLVAGGGNDSVTGGDGEDLIQGGNGNDTLNGMLGDRHDH